MCECGIHVPCACHCPSVRAGVLSCMMRRFVHSRGRTEGASDACADLHNHWSHVEERFAWRYVSLATGMRTVGNPEKDGASVASQ